MIGLKVLKLDPRAKLPVCAHPSEDLGYDIFSLDDVELLANQVTRIRTGIAVELPGMGFLMRDRSSMAMRSIVVSGGTIDAGYRGELLVNLTWYHQYDTGIIQPLKTTSIKAGDKIAQLVPIAPATFYEVFEVTELSKAARGTAGYGSTGR